MVRRKELVRVEGERWLERELVRRTELVRRRGLVRRRELDQPESWFRRRELTKRFVS